jgi:hypothetical protein
MEDAARNMYMFLPAEAVVAKRRRKVAMTEWSLNVKYRKRN